MPFGNVRLAEGLTGRPALPFGLRVDKPRLDTNIRALDSRVAHQVDPRPVGQGEMVGSRERQRAIGKLTGERLGQIAEPSQIGGVEMDDEAVRGDGPLERYPPFALERSLDSPLDLKGLQARPKQPGRRAFEEAFEEPLDGGQGRHGRWRSLAEACPAAGRGQAYLYHPLPTGVPTFRGRRESLRYTRPSAERLPRSDVIRAVPGDPMPEILTESFCERCGTRYTFESARPKTRLKGVKVLSRGLKNFVLSDDTTMDEAMAAARSETDRELTVHQLDAFHKTFNFCMSCRQYTCPNCWNEVEARCLSCAPLALDVLPATLPDLATYVETIVATEPATNGANGHVHDDVPADPWGIAAQPEIIATDADVVAAEPAIVAAEPEGVAAAPEDSAGSMAPPELAGEEPAAKASSQTSGLLRRFRPGQNLDDELAAYERDHTGPAEERSEPAPTDVDMVAASDELIGHDDVAAQAEPAAIEANAVPEIETAAEPELEAAPAAIAEPEPEPVVAAQPEPEIAPAFVLEATPEPSVPASDVVEQPTWRISAPDADGPTVPPASPTDGAVPIQANASPTANEPQWPSAPEWPATRPSAGLPFLGRPAQPQGGVEALWAASNQELVATRPAPGRTNSGIQPCISCGLSLSATAKFCRRCGTLQSG